MNDPTSPDGHQIVNVTPVTIEALCSCGQTRTGHDRSAVVEALRREHLDPITHIVTGDQTDLPVLDAQPHLLAMEPGLRFILGLTDPGLPLCGVVPPRRVLVEVLNRHGQYQTFAGITVCVDPPGKTRTIRHEGKMIRMHQSLLVADGGGPISPSRYTWWSQRELGQVTAS